jgi:alginate O-acetyltransferase complex protein AlgI
MIFSSTIFLVYFLPIFLFAYYFADRKYKNVVLLLASIVFYSWGAPKFVFLILGTTIVDFYLVSAMHKSEVEKRRKLFLILSLSLNLGLLAYFKYSNFFIENFNTILSAVGVKQVQWTNIVLPIGISFFIFESLTYVMDVYRKVHLPLKSFLDYQLYILLFPKLIAGPITRYQEIADQISDRSQNDTTDYKLEGFYRFAIGLGKKVLIANVLAAKADVIFAMPQSELSTSLAWIGALAYTFQIYFDFSGYSDMAIGLGKMIGFKFPENFNNPYTSGSITEFWRRWHMTLGNWMRNYLYIPLGGNKVKSNYRLFFNLWLVFILSGFWHGAAWTFIFWGIYHGFFLVIERLFLLKFYDKLGKWISIPITFLIVMIGWIFFRADTLHQGITIVSKLFSFKGSLPLRFMNVEFYTIISLAFLFSFFILIPGGKKMQQVVFEQTHSTKLSFALLIVSIILLSFSLASITSTGFNPFIYFRF